MVSFCRRILWIRWMKQDDTNWRKVFNLHLILLSLGFTSLLCYERRVRSPPHFYIILNETSFDEENNYLGNVRVANTL